VFELWTYREQFAVTSVYRDFDAGDTRVTSRMTMQLMQQHHQHFLRRSTVEDLPSSTCMGIMCNLAV
jgi:hypothetical protein